MTSRDIIIQGSRIGPGQPCYIIAEMSANHNQSFDAAVRIIHAAKEAGADAIKIQTYTADTITIQSDAPPFRIESGPWAGQTLHALYQQAYTPWEWQPKLKKEAESIGLMLFSSPFDPTAVDFLEDMGVPCYKIASFELVDIPLIEKCAATGKPLIMSTGMATFEEIGQAVAAARGAGARQIALLKCNSAYPAPPEEMNLRTIPHLAESFDVPVGLSDHTLGAAAAIAAVALGGCILEKHFTLSRAEKGPDSFFSIEPAEWREMVDAIRAAERALGGVSYASTAKEAASRAHRRSLFVVRDMKKGEVFTPENVRSIRPADGLAPLHYKSVLGRRAGRDIARATPLQWEHIEGGRGK